MNITVTASHIRPSSRPVVSESARDLDVSIEVSNSRQAILLLVGQVTVLHRRGEWEILGGVDSALSNWISDDLLTDLRILEISDFDKAVVTLRDVALAKCRETDVVS